MPAVKPSFPVIDRSHPLAQGLAFAFPFCEGYGGPVYDACNPAIGKMAQNGTVTWGGSSMGFAPTFDGSTAFYQTASREYNPVKTNNGVGTGDFTLMVSGNPISEANARDMLVNRVGSGGQFRLEANSNSALAITAGSFAFCTGDAGGTSNCAAAGVVDGNFHQFTGVRQGGNLTLYVDSVAAATGTSTRNILSAGQFFTIGRFADLGFNFYNKQMLYCYGWNLALSRDAIASILADPFQFFEQQSLIPNFA